jgi:hypothetical protein
MFLKEAAVHAGYKVLMGIGNSSFMILGDTQGFLDQKLKPQPICLYSCF